MGQWKESVAAYEKAVEISPRFLDARKSVDLVKAMHRDDPGAWRRTGAVTLVLFGGPEALVSGMGHRIVRPR